MILHSGAYDLDRLYHETSSQWLRSMLNPTGEQNSKLISILSESLVVRTELGPAW